MAAVKSHGGGVLIALSRKRLLAAIVLAALGALAAKVVEQTWDYFFKPFPLEVDVFTRVTQGKLVPAKNATVDLHLVAVEPKITDERGKALWKDLDPHPFAKMSIEVTLQGYHRVPGPPIAVRRRYGAVNIDLVPDETTQVGGPTSPVADVQKVYQSAPKPSGPSKQFGPWNELCSTDDGLAPNFIIKAQHFELTGDRQCNAWSECRQTVNSPRRVCYEFRMQGHEEWTGPFHGFIPSGNSGVALSQGILSLTWGPP